MSLKISFHTTHLLRFQGNNSSDSIPTEEQKKIREVHRGDTTILSGTRSPLPQREDSFIHSENNPETVEPTSQTDALKQLYPAVAEDEISLPNKPTQKNAMQSNLHQTLYTRSSTGIPKAFSSIQQSVNNQKSLKGQFFSCEELQEERLKKSRFTKPQVNVIASFKVLALVLPPALAGLAGLANTVNAYTFNALNYIFSLTADLTMNRVDLKTFKAKIAEVSFSFSNWVAEKTDRLKKTKGFQPHLVFLERLAYSLEIFSKNIEDKNHQECLEEALAFEAKTTQKIKEHILKYGEDDEKTKLSNLQKFMQHYDKHINDLPSNLKNLSDENRLKLESLFIQDRNSKIPELLEWSKNGPAYR